MPRRRRLTYANVMSTIAFVLALSAGTACAANEWTGCWPIGGPAEGADAAVPGSAPIALVLAVAC